MHGGLRSACRRILYLEWCFTTVCRPRSWPVSPRMIDVLENRAFPSRRRICFSWPADQRIFAQDRAMCGQSCPGRSSTGGVRDVAREVAQSWLEWMSSAVASRNKCTKQGSCTSCVANEKAVPGMTLLTHPGDLRAQLPSVSVGGKAREGGGTSACCSSEGIAKNAIPYRACCKAAQGSLNLRLGNRNMSA